MSELIVCCNIDSPLKIVASGLSALFISVSALLFVEISSNASRVDVGSLSFFVVLVQLQHHNDLAIKKIKFKINYGRVDKDSVFFLPFCHFH